MKKILVVNVNWLGDVVFSSPVFRALKVAYPEAQVSCLAVPRVKSVLESIPDVDEVIVYDEKGQHNLPWAKLKMAGDLRRKKFDAVFLLHGSMSRALLTFLAGIPIRVGYATKRRGIFLTHKVKAPEKPIHRSDHYLRVIESFGVEVKDRSTVLTVLPEAENEMGDILLQRGIFSKDHLIVIHPGGNWDLKRWPKENFVVLINRLVRERQAKVVIIGAGGEVNLAQEITSAVEGFTINLAGATNLKQLLALFKRAQLVISADSGPLHLANSVGANVFAIFGPTRPELTGPRGCGPATILQHDVGCNKQSCYYQECPDNICMKAVTVEEVLSFILK